MRREVARREVVDEERDAERGVGEGERLVARELGE
jgi:hypothetical protein